MKVSLTNMFEFLIAVFITVSIWLTGITQGYLSDAQRSMVPAGCVLYEDVSGHCEWMGLRVITFDNLDDLGQ